MKMGIYLNKMHRYVGICLAPFLVVQTMSGLLLDFGLFRRGGFPGTGEITEARSVADTLLVKLHFGPGVLSDCYHLLLGMGVIWMALSGWLLYLRIRRARKKSTAGAAPGGVV